MMEAQRRAGSEFKVRVFNGDLTKAIETLANHALEDLRILGQDYCPVFRLQLDAWGMIGVTCERKPWLS